MCLVHVPSPSAHSILLSLLFSLVSIPIPHPRAHPHNPLLLSCCRISSLRGHQTRMDPTLLVSFGFYCLFPLNMRKGTVSFALPRDLKHPGKRRKRGALTRLGQGKGLPLVSRLDQPSAPGWRPDLLRSSKD